MFLDHNEIKLEINNREIAEESPNIWKLNSKLLNNQLVSNFPGNAHLPHSGFRDLNLTTLFSWGQWRPTPSLWNGVLPSLKSDWPMFNYCSHGILPFGLQSAGLNIFTTTTKICTCERLPRLQGSPQHTPACRA